LLGSREHPRLIGQSEIPFPWKQFGHTGTEKSKQNENVNKISLILKIKISKINHQDFQT